MSSTKICKTCDCEQLLAKFYITQKRGDKITYSTLCKTHSDIKRKINYQNKPKNYKLKGFQKLDQEIQNKILKAIEEKINYKQISRDFKIPYATIMIWKKEKQFILPLKDAEPQTE